MAGRDADLEGANPRCPECGAFATFYDSSHRMNGQSSIECTSCRNIEYVDP